MPLPISPKKPMVHYTTPLTSEKTKRARTKSIEEVIKKSIKTRLYTPPSKKEAIDSIPTEIWSKIVVFLETDELVRCRQVNKMFQKKTKENFWSIREFNFPTACFTELWISSELSKQAAIFQKRTKQMAAYAEQPTRDKKGTSKQKKLLPFLKKTELISLSGASDNSIKALAKEANLEKVDLSYNKLITDEGIIALATLSSNLRSVSLLSCSNITDKSILHLVRSCPRLESLDIMFTNTTEDLHERLRREYPLLKFNAF